MLIQQSFGHTALWLISCDYCHCHCLLPFLLATLLSQLLTSVRSHFIAFFASALLYWCRPSNLLSLTLASENGNDHSTSGYDFRFLHSQPFHCCWLLRVKCQIHLFFKKNHAFGAVSFIQIIRSLFVYLRYYCIICMLVCLCHAQFEIIYLPVALLSLL